MKKEVILKELKKELKKLYADNLSEVILFGSYARNQETENSDIDVLVVLKTLASPGKEIDRMIDIVYKINLRENILISIVPILEEEYNSVNSPLTLNVRKEGIIIE